MSTLQNILPPHLFEAIDRVGISEIKQILTLSVWDVKKLTKLCADDILLLKSLVSDHISPEIVTCDFLNTHSNHQTLVTTGCSVIDNLLKGGLRRGTLTEIYGESGCGKTQLTLQTALHNWFNGCVYICTEDVFPTKRFEEMKMNLRSFNCNVDYGKNIFVEHITEAKDLLFCIRMRLPKLLTQHRISLITIDSVAAPFRCENTNYVKRAEELRELAILLISVAQEFNIAIVCLNQVTSSFDDTNCVLPALGLAWSNMVTTRLMLRKTMRVVELDPKQKNKKLVYNMYLRELLVVFSPELSSDMVELVITEKGIHGI